MNLTEFEFDVYLKIMSLEEQYRTKDMRKYTRDGTKNLSTDRNRR